MCTYGTYVVVRLFPHATRALRAEHHHAQARAAPAPGDRTGAGKTAHVYAHVHVSPAVGRALTMSVCVQQGSQGARLQAFPTPLVPHTSAPTASPQPSRKLPSTPSLAPKLSPSPTLAPSRLPDATPTPAPTAYVHTGGWSSTQTGYYFICTSSPSPSDVYLQANDYHPPPDH